MIIISMRMYLLLTDTAIERRYGKDSLIPNVRPRSIGVPKVLVELVSSIETVLTTQYWLP